MFNLKTMEWESTIAYLKLCTIFLLSWSSSQSICTCDECYIELPLMLYSLSKTIMKMGYSSLISSLL